VSDNTTHAVFSPSSAHRWMACPGSIAAERGLPNTDSKHSAEGTAAHTLGYRVLAYGKRAETFINQEIPAGGRIFVVDQAMADAVQMYADDVLDRAKGADLYIEQRTDLSEVLGVPEQFGTTDASIVDVAKRHLTIVDLKYGMGVKVYAEKNEQMMLYALGELRKWQIVGDFDFVTVVVCQPRLDHIDEWTCGLEDLLAFEAKAKAAVCTASADGAPLNPGEKQCRWCKAKATCPALAQLISQEVFDDFDSIDSPTLITEARPAVPSDGDTLGRRMGNLDIIEDWCRAVRSEGERRVLAGATIIGPDGLPYKVVEGRKGARKWKDEQAAEGLLTGQLGDKAYKPRTLISASDAAKIFDKKKTAATWAVFEPLIAQAPGRPSIVKGSDPRPPYSGAAAADEFDDGED
jgi:hypothetical protein